MDGKFRLLDREFAGFRKESQKIKIETKKRLESQGTF